MYTPGTILELKEPREAYQKTDPYTGEPRMIQRRNPKTGENEDTTKPHMLEFPYNRVEVVGESPVVATEDEWTGADARKVILKPLTDFAGNIDEPFGKVRKLYKVVFEPKREIPAEIKVIQTNANSREAGPSPEEVFAEKAPGKAPAQGLTRGRTVSPFADVKNDAKKGPLD